jgi:Uma2 family endonuclease
MTIAEYLELEKTSTVRHEYLDGEIYAMSGASRRHNLIAGNLHGCLRSHLRRGPCQVFIVDVKVYIEKLNIFYYPDLVVSCDPKDNDEYFVVRPVLVVEVESPSTSTIDGREKLMAYRKLESLREYLLLSQDSIGAELFRRDESGDWSLEQLGLEHELCLESVGMNVRLRSLYEDVGLHLD